MGKMGEGGVEEEQAFGGQVQPANPSANNPLHTFTPHKLMLMLVFLQKFLKFEIESESW